MADPGVMSERVFLGASGELEGSLAPPDGGEDDEEGAAGEEQGRMGSGGGGDEDRLVGVEQSAEVRMGTEDRPGSEEEDELGIKQEDGGRLWW